MQRIGALGGVSDTGAAGELSTETGTVADTGQHELGWDRLLSRGQRMARSAWSEGLWTQIAIAAAILALVVALSAMFEIRPDDVGPAAGDKDAIAVEILDASMFDDRYPALVPGASATPPPQQRTVAAPAPAVEQPAQPNQEAAAAASVAASKPPAVPVPTGALAIPRAALAVGAPALDLSMPQAALTAPSKQRQLTAAELVNKQLGGSARARAGEIDAYTRMIVRGLEQSKPVSNGVSGQLVVAFTVSPLGELQDLHLITSSGKPVLDHLIIAALTGLRFKVPPVGAERSDRNFEITYDYH